MIPKTSFIRLEDIKAKDCPVFVLSDDLRSLISFLIKQFDWVNKHEEGHYSHISCMPDDRCVATQGFIGYKKIRAEDYFKPNILYKFWRYKGFSHNDKVDILNMVEADLKKPWWRRRYDFLGIIGQMLRIKWLQNPFAYYCSEIAAKYLRVNSVLEKVIPERPSPADLNRIFKGMAEFECIGYYLGGGD